MRVQIDLDLSYHSGNESPYELLQELMQVVDDLLTSRGYQPNRVDPQTWEIPDRATVNLVYQ